MLQELVFLLLFLFSTLLTTINNAFINTLCVGPYILKLLCLHDRFPKLPILQLQGKWCFFKNVVHVARLLNLKVCGSSHFHQKYTYLSVSFSALVVITFVVDLISFSKLIFLVTALFIYSKNIFYALSVLGIKKCTGRQDRNNAYLPGV